MHALDVIFWSFFAAIVAFVAWSFLKLFAGALSDSRGPRNAGRGSGSGGISGGDSATLVTAADHGNSVTLGEAAGSDASGGDSGGGDFSGGGGESGGGGSSGGW
ncbi:MAG TPA: hypothetical protein VGF28_25525 [Thermoanaerobaculia bacterium]|jgi:uncharacterized protein